MNKNLLNKRCEVKAEGVTWQGVCVGGAPSKGVFVFKRETPPWCPDQYFTVVVNDSVSIEVI